MKKIFFSISFLICMIFCYDICDSPNNCSNSLDGKNCVFVQEMDLKICRKCDPTLYNKNCECGINEYCVGDTEDVMIKN